MSRHLILLSVPGLRAKDLSHMPNLMSMANGGQQTQLAASFPAVTWPVQTAMLTGRGPSDHGVVANGFYWRDREEVEMWTAWNEVIQSPQIWDVLRAHDPTLTSAVWFPMLSKGSSADYVCMPAPIHNPDGSESLWCYTKPQELYGTLRDLLGHFPLQHFWGPMANIKSTAWIAESAKIAIERFRPNFFFVYLPHLDYAAQKFGPDSDQATSAVVEMDQVIGDLIASGANQLPRSETAWMVASEYAIVPVSHVTYPNRVLRDAGLVVVEEREGEVLDVRRSAAWALVDHQFSHVFIRDRDEAVVRRVCELFSGAPGIAEVLAGDGRKKYGMNHERSGDVVLISEPHSWQAYYWWLDDARAPAFARTVDIHRKPGYDPVELIFDLQSRSIPLDATLIRGSHGAPVSSPDQEGVLVSSVAVPGASNWMCDRDIFDCVLRYFGVPVARDMN